MVSGSSCADCDSGSLLLSMHGESSNGICNETQLISHREAESTQHEGKTAQSMKTVWQCVKMVSAETA